jgi:hypothetical protein
MGSSLRSFKKSPTIPHIFPATFTFYASNQVAGRLSIRKNYNFLPRNRCIPPARLAITRLASDDAPRRIGWVSAWQTDHARESLKLILPVEQTAASIMSPPDRAGFIAIGLAIRINMLCARVSRNSSRQIFFAIVAKRL